MSKITLLFSSLLLVACPVFAQMTQLNTPNSIGNAGDAATNQVEEAAKQKLIPGQAGVNPVTAPDAAANAAPKTIGNPRDAGQGESLQKSTDGSADLFMGDHN